MDPIQTDPNHYRIVFENDRVRVLEYLDAPGDSTHDHSHPDSVMVTLAGFRRRLHQGERTLELELEPLQARWLDAQTHRGENIGDTATHAMFIELKEPGETGVGRLGPSIS